MKSRTQRFRLLKAPSEKPFLKSIWPFNSEKSYRRTVNYLLFDHDWTKKVSWGVTVNLNMQSSYLMMLVSRSIILPRKHQVTKVIVKYFNEEGNHASGTHQMLTVLSTWFWIISGREEILEWEKECNKWRRRKAKAAKQIMAPLPQITLQLSLRPFAQTAVDFGGPFVTIQGRRSRRQKRYLSLIHIWRCRRRG